MARYLTAGMDYQYFPSTGATLDGRGKGTTAPVADLTLARNPGGTSLKCVGSTTNTSYYQSESTVGGSGQTRTWLRVNALPTTAATIWGMYDPFPTAGIALWGVLQTNGTIQFYRDKTTPVAIGNPTAPITVDTWFCIQHRSHPSVAPYLVIWVDGTEIVRETTSQTGQNSGVQLSAGWFTAPGTAATCWVDDVALNDYTGPHQAGVPPINGSVLILPLSRVVTNTGSTWHTCKNTTTEADILQALRSEPPAGHADSTSDSTAHQVRNVTNGATTAQVLELECQSFGRAGVAGNVYLEPGAATYSAFGNTSARTRIGQGFYMNGTLELPRLWLRKQGTPTDNVTLSLCADSSGVPSGTVLQTSTIDGSTLSTTAAPIDFAFAPEPLTPLAKYWITLERSGAVDASNYYQVETCASGLYYDGGESLYNASWGAATLTTAWHMRLYSTGGVSWITVLYLNLVHAEAVSTGTKSGQYGMTVPTIAAKNFSYGGDAGAAGTFPTLWTWPSKVAPLSYSMNMLVPNAALMPRPWFSKTDSGTRAGLACSFSVMCEWSSVEGEWLQFTKIVGGVTWYGKHCAGITRLIRTDDTELLIDAGDWIMTTALLNEGENFNAGTISVTDSTLRTDYTLVGPAG